MRLRQLTAAGSVSLLLLTACGGGGGGGGGGSSEADSVADMDTITLKLSSHEGPETATGAGFEAFKKYVEEESDGKIAVELYMAGSLVAPTDALAATTAGTADIAQLITPYFPQDLPVSNWALNLGATADPSLPYGDLQQSAAFSDLFFSEQSLLDEYEKNNIKVLNVWSTEPYSLICKEPVETLEQAKGKRVRVSGALWAAEVEAIGMVPVTLTPPEVYEALQRGAIDCAAFSAGAVFINGYFDIAEHYTPVKMSSLPGVVLAMNLDVWDSLPSDAQEIVAKGGEQVWSTFQANQMELVAGAGEAENAIFHSPAALDEVISAHQDAAIESMVTNAPAEVSDGQAFVDNYNTFMAEWETVLQDDLGLEPTPRDPDSIQESYANAADYDSEKLSELLWEAWGPDVLE